MPLLGQFGLGFAFQKLQFIPFLRLRDIREIALAFKNIFSFNLETKLSHSLK